jgi:hypothetical protein
MNPFLAAGAAFGIMLVLVVLNSTMGANRGSGWRNQSRAAKTLIREAAQYTTVADQDTSALLALMHTTYATAYLNAARQLGNDGALEKVSGVHVGELMAMIQDKQQNSVANVIARCPEMHVDSGAIRAAGWIS